MPFKTHRRANAKNVPFSEEDDGRIDSFHAIERRGQKVLQKRVQIAWSKRRLGDPIDRLQQSVAGFRVAQRRQPERFVERNIEFAELT